MLLRHVWPFMINMGVLYLIILIMYSNFGGMLYGGLINNEIIQGYQHKTGLTLGNNYHYLHFNDILSSFLTLLVLLINNNWIYVCEHLLHVNNSFLSWTFIISYNMLVSFILTSLFFGVISRLIMIYFESDFDSFDLKQSKIDRSIETATDESESMINGSVASK